MKSDEPPDGWLSLWEAAQRYENIWPRRARSVLKRLPDNSYGRFRTKTESDHTIRRRVYLSPLACRLIDEMPKKAE